MGTAAPRYNYQLRQLMIIAICYCPRASFETAAILREIGIKSRLVSSHYVKLYIVIFPLSDNESATIL